MYGGFTCDGKRGCLGLLVSSPQYCPSASSTQNLKIELGPLGLTYHENQMLCLELH